MNNTDMQVRVETLVEMIHSTAAIKIEVWFTSFNECMPKRSKLVS